VLPCENHLRTCLVHFGRVAAWLRWSFQDATSSVERLGYVGSCSFRLEAHSSLQRTNTMFMRASSTVHEGCDVTFFASRHTIAVDLKMYIGPRRLCTGRDSTNTHCQYAQNIIKTSNRMHDASYGWTLPISLSPGSRKIALAIRYVVTGAALQGPSGDTSCRLDSSTAATQPISAV